jgi:hypothetical protein
MAAKGNAPQPRVSGELFAMTYGCTVNMLLHEVGGTNTAAAPTSIRERCAEVNATLFSMGQRIGFRIVDDFLATRPESRCEKLKDAVMTIADHALPRFLNIRGAKVEVVNGAKPDDEFLLTFDASPLHGVAELPADYRDHLWYSNVVCGAIHGALDLIGMKTRVEFVKCKLRGADSNQILIANAAPKP